MQHRYCFEAVDRTLRDICGKEDWFGGITILFAGDFRQCLPVVPKGSQGQIIRACITSSPIWQHIRRLRLTVNMRLQRPDMSDGDRQAAEAHAKWLLEIGDGVPQGSGEGMAQIPPNIYLLNSEQSLIDFVYPGIRTSRMSVDEQVEYFGKRAILSPRNNDVDGINAALLHALPGIQRTYFSADPIRESDGVAGQRPALASTEQMWRTDYLNTIVLSGMPLHNTAIKVGCPVMLLRNLDPSEGLCNGTRIIVTQMNANVIEGRVLSGDHVGRRCLIPRIGLDSATTSGLPFILRRRQFPIRLSFAMTINKSQGQSLHTVGVNLTQPVFAHGQLYVALSRGQDGRMVKVLLDGTEDGKNGKTKNLVYKEVLNKVKEA